MMMQRTLLAASLTALLCAAGAHADVPDYDLFELQARSNLIVNDNGFNVPPGTSFNNISAVINDQQQVSFSAGVVPIDNDLSRSGGGVWLGGHGEGGFVVVHEPPAGDPNDPPMVLVSDRPSLNTHGEIAYYTSIDGGPYTLRRYDPLSGQSTPVSVLPLTPSSYGNVGLTDNGEIGFKARLGAGYGFGMHRSSGNSLYAVDSNVDAATGYAYLYSPATNNQARMAGKVSSSDYNHNEIRVFDGTGSTLVVADKATDPASPFSKFDNGLAYNDQGAIAVALTLADGNVRALYRFTPNGSGGYESTEIARVEAAGAIRAIDSFAPAITDNGVVVFRGRDANGQAIFAGDGTTLHRVIGKGDVVATDQGPGQIGQHIDDPNSWPIFSGAPTVNAQGDIAFVAALHPQGDNQIEWGSGVFVAYAGNPPIDDDVIFANGFEAPPALR